MNHVKDFEEFLSNGKVKKQFPDIPRSKSLVEESEESYEILSQFIKTTGINNKNANHIIKNAYDILMALIRARMLLKGFNSSGQGAHEAEVAFLRELDVNENDIEFADKLRYFRNGILYYGKKFDAEYAQKVISFVEKSRKMLRN